MKSVPNWISYLHNFFCIFSQLLAICFELFSSGSVFNSENHCCGIPSVSLSLSTLGPLVSKPFPRRAMSRGSAATCPRPCLKGVVPTASCACSSHAAPTARPLASPHASPRQPCPKPPPLCFRPRVSKRALASSLAERATVFSPLWPSCSPPSRHHVLWLPATSPSLFPCRSLPPSNRRTSTSPPR
jgi:hypothetical protein